MRMITLDGRASLLVPAHEGAGDATIDVHTASAGRFPAEPDSLFEQWDTFRAWADTVDPASAVPLGDRRVGPPVARPRQVFAIGANYHEHADEAGIEAPADPLVFGKFVGCLTGPHDPVTLPSEAVDWEVELVVVIGRRADHVAVADGWAHVAGLTVGQDLSERAVQFSLPVLQLALAKSYPGFGPIGPVLVTPDEFDDPDDLGIACSIGDEVLQADRTARMIFPVAELVSRLSMFCPLLPGDLIFTGTPAGVGAARTPPRFLRPGETLVSRIEGIGELRNPLIARQPAR
ncbi:MULTISPECIES: fumarylacetoacetate hydrolase family protein [unclassified Embleya]|uniref:fumarylacetoacetate hydrolase family protein n=1 Tax=unclassified Embleya TaxID=2699296 RepID=UPI0033EE96A5